MGFGVGGLGLFELGFGLPGSEVEGFLLEGVVVAEDSLWDLLRWDEAGGRLGGLFEGCFGGFPPAMLTGEARKAG